MWRLFAAFVLGLSVVAVPTGVAHAATWTAPRFERMVGGPSTPLVYAWGMAYNPVVDEVWVGDYLNFRIRRFSRSGQYLGDFGQPRALTGGIPYGIAVDPRDGSVYEAQIGGGKGKAIAKYSKDGTFLWDFNWAGNIGFLAVDQSGYLYTDEVFGGSYRTSKLRIDDVNHTVTEVAQFGTPGHNAGQTALLTGVAVAHDGRVFTVDPGNNVVHAYAPNGTWLGDVGSRGTGPGHFSGDMRGIVVDDAANRIYVADSQEGQIEVFSLSDYSHVETFGSLGFGPGQFADGARGLALTPDGNLWAADYGNLRVEQFQPDGTYVGAYPSPPAEPDISGFSELRGVAVDRATGDIVTADPWNQRMQRFSSDGQPLSTLGRRGSFPPYGTNYPRSVAVDPATGNTWLVNYENEPFTEVYDRNGNFLAQYDQDRFYIDIEFANGKVYYANYWGRNIMVRDAATGAVLSRFNTPDRLNGIGVDPQTGEMYAASGDHNYVSVYSSSGALERQLTVDRSPYGVLVDGDVVYVTDVGANEVIAFDRTTGTRLGTFGGSGSKPGQFKAPSGIDMDNQGNIYIADAQNQRVQVFTFDPPASSESNIPVTSIDPPSGASVPPPIVLTGHASDDTGVAYVQVSVQDTTTGLWWNAYNSTWMTTRTWNNAGEYGPQNAASWRFAVTGARLGGSYLAYARSYDMSGNQSKTTKATRVNVGDAGPPDTTIDTPADASTTQPGLVALHGTATDDLGLGSVQVSVTDRQTGLSWDPSTSTWSASTVWYAGSLTTVGARQSAWQGSFDATVAAGSGQYTLAARATDQAANTDPSPAQVSFVVGTADTAAPDTTIDSPTANEVIGSPALFSGSAVDNVSVPTVRVSVHDDVNSTWWNASTQTFGASQVWNATSVVTSGHSSSWSLSTPLPPGAYTLKARATDAALNNDATPASAHFTVTSDPSDTTPPTVGVTTPTRDVDLAASPTLGGPVADNTSVAAVRATILDRNTGLWWNQSKSSFQTSLVWNLATLTSPGAASTSWSLPTSLPSGRYQIQVRAIDGAGQTTTATAVPFSVDWQAPGYAQFDRWDNFGGTALNNIPTGTAPSAQFLSDATTTGLDFNTNQDNFGFRVRVLLTPQTTGDYTFWLASDDNGALLLNPNSADPTGATQIASVPGYTGRFEWTKYSQQQSIPIHLLEGHDYYLEMMVKEGGGEDFGTVGWQLNGTTTPGVIAPSYFRSAGSLGAGGWRPGTPLS